MKIRQLNKAKRICNGWQGGQWSALYQFGSSGIFAPENTLRYLQEIETCLHPEYNLHPGELTKGQETELNYLKDYFTGHSLENDIVILYKVHPIYGYNIPYIYAAPAGMTDSVTQLKYAI